MPIAQGATDIGRVRSANEDSFACLEPPLYIVADGMGGAAAGEIASGILVGCAKDIAAKWPKARDESFLRLIITAANDAILADAEAHPRRRGMGTTATMLAIDDEAGVWAHVGDSRLYLLRGSSLCQITADHSYVADLVRAGTITAEEAMHHPQKNFLMRAVGVKRRLEIDTGRLELAAGDKLLLCSDGLSNMVSEEKIVEILQSDMPNKAEILVASANEAGGQDNATAVVVAV